MELLDDSLQSEETQKCPFQYLGFLHTRLSVFVAAMSNVNFKYVL